MIIPINLGKQSYNIILERGALNNAFSYLRLDRRVLIVTDSGVPKKYAEAIKSQSKNAIIYIIKEGEESKNINNYMELLKTLVENKFTRTDCVVAVGGGVCGDLAGFVASTYMRGIDFYNVPTTLLSQVDSSIGGKVAVDFYGVKNIVGAFYQPKAVLIDPEVLTTLDKRQLHAGLCESIKMAATSDRELFELIEKSTNLEDDLDEIIYKSLLIKKDVVEKDPNEKGLRKVLNFGHTIGHAIEGAYNLNGYLHGECVGMGMLYMCSDSVKARLKSILEKYEIPMAEKISEKELIKYISVDKKANGSKITIIYVESLGSFEMREIEIKDICDYINGGAK
jgi:3-dehydroquinate synthase